MSKITIHTKVLGWAEKRGILEGKVETQVLKGISELGELADAIIKQDKDLVRDAIGDTIVVLHSVTYLKLRRHFVEDHQLVYGETIELWNKLALHKLPIRNTELDTDLDNLRSALHNTGWLTHKHDHPYDVFEEVNRIVYALHLIALRNKLTVPECLESAYEEIKNRKGKTLPNGNFVKES